jgi:hypothetical protein
MTSIFSFNEKEVKKCLHTEIVNSFTIRKVCQKSSHALKVPGLIHF